MNYNYSDNHTSYGHAQSDRYGLGALDVAPSSGKVPGTNSLVDVHLERVVVTAHADAVDPGKEDVSLLVGLQSRQKENGQPAYEGANLKNYKNVLYTIMHS